MKFPKGYSIPGIILFALSMVYLGAELVFNKQLLDVSSNVQSDPDQVEHIQYFGRAASGLGFTLLVQGIFQQFDFRIVKRKHWIFFIAVALICLMPFLMTLGQSIYEKIAGAAATGDVPYTAGMYWGFLSLAGIAVALAGRTRKRAVILGLVLMTWPAMFYGQRLAVERFVISPTAAEERLNAHFILLLRSAIEDCKIELDGVQFCDAKTAQSDAVEKRSTRAVLGAMFMLNTGAVFDGLNFSRKQLIASIAAQDMWFSSKDYYQRYLRQIIDRRAEYEQTLNDSYYMPYKQASDLYAKIFGKATTLLKQASESGELERIAAEADTEVTDQVNTAWLQYQRAATLYNSYSDSAAAAASSGGAAAVYSRLCKGRESLCKSAMNKVQDSGNMDSIISVAKSRAYDEFYNKTGYPPDIGSRDEFIRNNKTQAEILDAVEKKLQEHIEGYVLPMDWQYDPDAFRQEILTILQDQARGKAVEIASRAQRFWQDKVQSQFKTRIKPGLSRDEFFKALGGDPLPPLKEMAMTEDDFRQKYVLPMNQEIADKTIDDMKKEGPSFANRQEKAERGKEYIRVLYVPPIALCLSIMIVVVTIGRYLTTTATDASKKLRWVRGFSYRQLKMIRPFYWAIYLSMVLILPYKWPNPYTATKAYQKYFHYARTQSPVIAQTLDWVVHVQPIVYRAGAWMPSVGYKKK